MRQSNRTATLLQKKKDSYISVPSNDNTLGVTLSIAQLSIFLRGALFFVLYIAVLKRCYAKRDVTHIAVCSFFFLAFTKRCYSKLDIKQVPVLAALAASCAGDGPFFKKNAGECGRVERVRDSVHR